MRFGVPFAALGWDGKLDLVDHLHDATLGEVDVRHDPVDGVRPRQVRLVLLVEGEDADDAVPDLVLVTEHAGRQGNRPDLRRFDAALGHRREPVGAAEQERLDVLELLVEDRHVAVGGGIDGGRADHAVLRHRHDEVGADAGGAIEQQDPGASLDRVARCEREDRGLVRLGECDEDEAHVLADQSLVGEERFRRPDLVRRQRSERMVRGWRNRWRPGSRWWRYSSCDLLVDDGVVRVVLR